MAQCSNNHYNSTCIHNDPQLTAKLQADEFHKNLEAFYDANSNSVGTGLLSI